MVRRRSYVKITTPVLFCTNVGIVSATLRRRYLLRKKKVGWLTVMVTIGTIWALRSTVRCLGAATALLYSMMCFYLIIPLNTPLINIFSSKSDYQQLPISSNIKLPVIWNQRLFNVFRIANYSWFRKAAVALSVNNILLYTKIQLIQPVLYYLYTKHMLYNIWSINYLLLSNQISSIYSLLIHITTT